ncbi:hypothetical protein H8A99_26445 [Bradyrhizobium sp. Arg68]|nr:hypothetical protein [Bradyrhizobium ivorense]
MKQTFCFKTGSIDAKSRQAGQTTFKLFGIAKATLDKRGAGKTFRHKAPLRERRGQRIKWKHSQHEGDDPWTFLRRIENFAERFLGNIADATRRHDNIR